ncbi:MAG: deoxyribonuclease IV [Aquificae bacterium]|nr:deoxyribonuclease IV [Aquificota bacterium]
MALFGLHVSSAGGIEKTFKRAKDYNAEVFQFFLRSPRSWRWKEPSGKQKEEFRSLLSSFSYPVVVHAPYVFNLASKNEELRRKSVRALSEELRLCDELGIQFYNVHPGICGDEEEGIGNVVRSLEEVFSLYEPRRTFLLLENTAGRRGEIGKSFRELGRILGSLGGARVGVCVDTCHAFAFGYEINTRKGLYFFKKELDRFVGLERVFLVHANDSKVPVGSRKDRHEHIGRGFIGLEGFRNLLRDEDFSRLPYCIETPKEGDMDRENLRILRELSEE